MSIHINFFSSDLAKLNEKKKKNSNIYLKNLSKLMIICPK